MVPYIVFGFVIVVLIYVFLAYNGLVKATNTVHEAFSTMDVYLKKRWDLIPNIIETVKGYAKYEQDTLEEIVRLRDCSYDAMSEEKKIETNDMLTKSISKIKILAENYPILKANENFLDLSRQLAQVEADIANSRKYYNAVIRHYNNKVQMFPSNVIAGIFGYKTKEMFETSTEERENIKVQF